MSVEGWDQLMAFNRLGKQGIWTDKTHSRRTKLTIYKGTVLTILLHCAETWSIGPADVKKLGTAHMPCLRRICGDRSWGPDSTPLPPLMLKSEDNVKCLPSKISSLTTDADG
jgi:hypothetical protein